MATIAFDDITFREHEGKIRGTFLGRYYFDIAREDLERIGPTTVKDGTLEIQAKDEYAKKRFNPILDKAFNSLRHINYDKPTVYIHRNSGVPLIGTNEFGIVDRGSNIIEIKPLTGCNFNCPYCSVDEGKNDKTHDYIVEAEYLIEAAAEVAKIKTHPVEFHIGPQGEPFLYPKFTELVRGLKQIPNTENVTVVTNGSLLTEKLIDELAEAGLTKINLSLNALDQQTADMMSGRKYPLQHVLKMVKYCQGKINVILAPTIVPGWNDNEIEPIAQLGKTLEGNFPPVGFQNFLIYKRGRNPVKPRSFDAFYELLKPAEASTGMRLTGYTKEDFHIHDEKEIEKPFKKRDTIKAKIAIPSRFPNETIAVAKGRCITVMGKDIEHLAKGKSITIKIVRDKHNIYKGVIA